MATSQPGPLEVESPALPHARSGSAVTFAIIAANVIMFVLMSLASHSFLQPTTGTLLRWGADYGPLTLHGQWWRAFTSMFVHIGVMHILFNMYVLLNIGPFMERLSGGFSYLVLYVVAGLGGAAASLAWSPVVVSAGASGAIFGLYGGLLGFLLWHRNTIPAEALKPLLKGAVIFVGYNLVYGALQSGIDMAAHIGGLTTGFVLGLFLVRPGSGTSETLFNSRVMLAIALGVVLLFGTVSALPKPDDFSGAFEHFSTVEDSTLKLYNSSIEQWKDGKITDEQFLNVLDNQVLAPWKQERQAMASLSHLPSDQARMARSLIHYMDTRAESWTLLSQGVRQADLDKMQEATAKGKEADEIAGQLESGSQH